MVERLVVWDVNCLIKVGCFTPQVILSGIANRGMQRTGEIKRKTPIGDGNRTGHVKPGLKQGEIKRKTPIGDGNLTITRTLQLLLFR